MSLRVSPPVPGLKTPNPTRTWIFGRESSSVAQPGMVASRDGVGGPKATSRRQGFPDCWNPRGSGEAGSSDKARWLDIPGVDHASLGGRHRAFDPVLWVRWSWAGQSVCGKIRCGQSCWTTIRFRSDSPGTGLKQRFTPGLCDKEAHCAMGPSSTWTVVFLSLRIDGWIRQDSPRSGARKHPVPRGVRNWAVRQVDSCAGILRRPGPRRARSAGPGRRKKGRVAWISRHSPQVRSFA